MLIMIAAAAIAADYPNPAAQAAVQSCLAGINGPQQSQLWIHIARGADGAIVDRYVTMIPPKLDENPRDARLTLRTPEVRIDYAYPQNGVFGRPIRVRADAQASRDRQLLSNARISVSLDGELKTTTPLQEPLSQHGELRRAQWAQDTPAEAQVIAAMDAARTADVVLTSASNKTMASARYDLAYEAVRDSLFSKLAPRVEDPNGGSWACTLVSSVR